MTALYFGGELGIRTLGTLRTQHFECCTFDHSDNSPDIHFARCCDLRRRHLVIIIYNTVKVKEKMNYSVIFFSSIGIFGRKFGNSIVLDLFVTESSERSPTAVHSQALYTSSSGCVFVRMALMKSSTMK